MIDALSGADDLTAPFWAACTRGELVRPLCLACDRSFFTPRWSCPHCRSTDWEYRRSSGRGSVYSSTVVHRGPDASWPTPYVLAIVDLDEGWSMLSRLQPGAEPDTDSAHIGNRVHVDFVPEGRPPHRTLPVFVLEDPS